MSPNTKQLEGIHDFRFGTTKSDEEIVSNYDFTLDIETLLMNPMTRERAKNYKKTGFIRPPRPQNSFILYRRNKTAELDLVGLKSAEKSKIISELWKGEPENVKEVFSALSRMAEVKYIERYGKVKYQPNRKSKQKKVTKPVESNLACRIKFILN